MKIVLLLLAVSVIQISAEECVGKKKVRLEKGLTMRCQGGVWKAVQRKSAHASKPCEDNPELSANGTCSADRGHCQQFTQKGSEMDRSCPGTCNSCDACNCQDSHQWHKYCSYWTQYCQDPGMLGTWMTSNCRKTCGKCRCPCCSYKGTSHALGSRISLPKQCGVLECQESLIAGDSTLLPGAKDHTVSHPEELTLNFLSLHDGADCCILPDKAKGVGGTEYDKDDMVEEGWGGSILMTKGPVQAHCCHGTLTVPLEDAESSSSYKTTRTSTSSTTSTISRTPIIHEVISHPIARCDTSYLQGRYECEKAFNGDFITYEQPGYINGWAYGGKIPAWVVFYLKKPVTTNTIIFKTGLKRGDHHLNDFAIEVQVGNKFEPVTITKVNSAGAKITWSRVKIAGQEEVRVAFETKTGVTAIKVHAYGSDGNGNPNSVVNEIWVLFLTNADMSWSQNDVDVILNEITSTTSTSSTTAPPPVAKD